MDYSSSLPTPSTLFQDALREAPPDPVLNRLAGLRDLSRGRRWRPVLRLTAGLTARLLGETGLRRLVDGPWERFVELGVEQVARNRSFLRQTANLPPEARRTLRHREPGGFFRRYHQLPVSRYSLERRVELVSAMACREEPLLLLGDDDLLSVALSRSGFTDVTAVDVDRRVLERIGESAGRVRRVRHDLSRPLPPDLRRDYRVVAFDPPCTFPGVRLFLDRALEALESPDRAGLLLSTHLMSLGEEGLRDLESHLRSRRLRAESLHLGVNAYPLSGPVGTAIRVVGGGLAILMGLDTVRFGDWLPRYFISDALVLRGEAPGPEGPGTEVVSGSPSRGTEPP